MKELLRSVAIFEMDTPDRTDLETDVFRQILNFQNCRNLEFSSIKCESKCFQFDKIEKKFATFFELKNQIYDRLNLSQKNRGS